MHSLVKHIGISILDLLLLFCIGVLGYFGLLSWRETISIIREGGELVVFGGFTTLFSGGALFFVALLCGGGIYFLETEVRPEITP